MSQTFRRATAVAALALMAALILSACEEEGPAEQVGEALDESANDIGRALEDAADFTVAEDSAFLFLRCLDTSGSCQVAVRSD